MNRLLLQTDLFTEDETQDTEAIIRKYFDVNILPDDYVKLYKASELRKEWEGEPFRGSLSAARMLGRKYEYANALKFMPPLRGHLVNPDINFTDLTDLLEKNFWFDGLNGQSKTSYERFIRPVSGFKEFAGQVFTYDTFVKEYEFMKQRNADLYQICATCSPVNIFKEWRCIFIDRKYVSGSQYIENGETKLETGVPQEVQEFAEMIAANPFFDNIFEFVIDVAETYRLALIEVNAFDTASFYSSDLDKIYSTWAKSIKV